MLDDDELQVLQTELAYDPAVGQCLWGFVLPGVPVAKARPRMTRSGHTFTPARTVNAEQELCFRLNAAGVLRSGPETGTVALALRFYLPGHGGGDLDNYVKLILDGFNRAGVWADDAQVTSLRAELRVDAENPRTLIVLAEHSSGVLRGPVGEKTCEGCSATFPARPSSKQRFCSRSCAGAARRAA